ncbi:MAG: hypothetical protein U1E95_02885 [Rubrivivax sp.]|nr:hypothetical protein [Pseudomonadota bacterium]
MTTLNLKLYYAPPVEPANPRGARAAAAAYGWMLAALRPLADRLAARRAAAAARRRAQEVLTVRTLAWQIRATDPRVAGELSAAADRYEQQHGG